MAGNDNEEIRRLAELGAHMEHVLRAIGELKAQLAELVTRAELSAVLDRIKAIEARVEDQSPLAIWKRVTAVAVGVAAIAAAVGVFVAFVDKFK